MLDVMQSRPIHKILRKYSSEKKRENGVVFTPQNLASYVAYKLISFYIHENNITGQGKIKDLKIIDPACGEGELLISAWNELQNKIDISNINPINLLCGVDLDEVSISRSINKIKDISTHGYGVKYNFIAANALLPRNKELDIQSWKDLKKHFNALSGVDLLIANPPWGAEISSYVNLLGNEFTLKKGQFDSSDLFVELAINIVKKNGYFAFILPDSLFGYEHKELRKLLLEKTEIKFIGRLGEKIFGGVNRACVVVVCRNKTPSNSNKVQCLRLTPELRNRILDNKLTFQEAEKSILHYVPQIRFTNNSDFLFDIDTKSDESTLIKKITDSKEIIGNYVDSSRGVELSKSGLIYKCLKCGFWSPLPAKNESKCKHCGNKIILDTIQPTKIISKEKLDGSTPILVGESLRRYSITSKYWITLNSKGINYKSISLYYEPKILVRKTGVGITASIDYSNSLTNQVVYIFKPKKDSLFSLPLEFILAVMNSRVIYYYLLKKYGETEWRTHPYLTQSQILKLPLPNVSSNQAKKIQKNIVLLLKPYLEQNTKLPVSVDAKVEYLISKLYQLDIDDYRIIYNALNSTQGLIPVKELSVVDIKDIFKH